MRRKFGNIVDRGNGSFVIRWSSPAGKRCSATVRGTREQAERELALRYGTETSARTITWDEYWRLFVEPSFDGLAERTVYGYRQLWSHDLGPRIGASRISDCSHRYVQNVVDGFGSRSVQSHVLSLFRKICNMAIRDGMMDSNPCAGVRLVRAERKRKRLWTVPEALEALDAVRGCMFEPLVLMELGGGLRHEEACGMHWDDIAPYKDLCALRVQRAVVSVGGRVVVKETKTEGSERIVVVGEPFASRLLELKRHSAEQAYAQVMHGPGGYRDPGSPTRAWKRFAERRGLVYVPFGQMRSNFATLHGEAFSPDGLVSLAMGHTDGTTRGKHYQQATVDGLERIARNLAGHFDACMAGDPEERFDAAAIFGG